MLIRHKNSLELFIKILKELILMKQKSKHKISVNNYFCKTLCMISLYLMRVKIKVKIYKILFSGYHTEKRKILMDILDCKIILQFFEDNNIYFG